MKKNARLFVVTNCKECPNCYTERTPGAGFAHDYRCKVGPKPHDKRKIQGGNMIAGYVEWPSEEPKDYDFPDFCPLQKDNK